MNPQKVWACCSMSTHVISKKLLSSYFWGSYILFKMSKMRINSLEIEIYLQEKITIFLTNTFPKSSKWENIICWFLIIGFGIFLQFLTVLTTYYTKKSFFVDLCLEYLRCNAWNSILLYKIQFSKIVQNTIICWNDVKNSLKYQM